MISVQNIKQIDFMDRKISWMKKFTSLVKFYWPKFKPFVALLPNKLLNLLLLCQNNPISPKYYTN